MTAFESSGENSIRERLDRYTASFCPPTFPLISIKYAIIATTLDCLVIVRIYVPWKFISSVSAAFHSYQFPISSLVPVYSIRDGGGDGGGGSIFRIILGRDTWKLHGD